MGININRFVGRNKISPEFVCGICDDIIYVPKQVNCNCEHIFCYSCILIQVQGQSVVKCPYDRMPIEQPYFKTPSRYWMDNYNRIKVKCLYHNIGCKAFVEIRDIVIHEISCEHNPDSLVICKTGCEAEIPRKSLKSHNCITYLKGRIDKISNSKPKLQTPHYCDSIQNEIEIIKSRLNDLEKGLKEIIERLNESTRYEKMNCYRSYSNDENLLDFDENVYESVAQLKIK